MALSERDVAILDFERTCFQHDGPKEERIRRDLAISPTRYYEILGALVESTAAYEYDPLTVVRVRKARGERRRIRIEGAGGIKP